MNIKPPETACDKEPIHIPGAIQPHGVLLVVDQASQRVIHGAGPVEHVIGTDDWLDASLGELLTEEAAAAILQGEAAVLRNVVPRHASGRYDITISRLAQELLVELEPASAPEVLADLMLEFEAARHAFDSVTDVETLMHRAAQEFRRLTQFDRVMVYKFLDDGAGKVVAEDVAPELESFLNHHFPASDIPAQARALYLRNLVRVIPDVGYVPAPLRPVRGEEKPLDMSDSILRSVSPVHIQYLKNMGVGASASFSLVKEGELWGLIACHNMRPRGLNWDQRTICRALSSTLARQIKAKEDVNAYRERVRLRSFEDRIIELLSREGSLSAALSKHLSEVKRMFNADGVAVVRADELVSTGKCPPEPAIRELAAWLGEAGPSPVFASSELSATSAPAAAVGPLSAGLLAITLSPSEPWKVLWFRAEAVEVVEWAGNPHKAASWNDDEPLTPRSSFSAWSETVRGKARPWTVPEVSAAEHLAVAIRNVAQHRQISDLNKELLTLVNQKETLLKQREFLLGEVNHRVQNSLTLVSTFLAMQARESTNDAGRQSIEEARRRIAAVSLVHRRLYGTDQLHSVDGARYVEELLDDLFASLGETWQQQLKPDLHPVLLPNDRAISVGLILTELVINATKYAYDGEAGPVTVILTEHQNQFRLEVSDNGRGRGTSSSGYGTRMIDALVQQLGGNLDFVSNSPGTKAVLTAPVSSAR